MSKTLVSWLSMKFLPTAILRQTFGNAILLLFPTAKLQQPYGKATANLRHCGSFHKVTIRGTVCYGGFATTHVSVCVCELCLLIVVWAHGVML